MDEVKKEETTVDEKVEKTGEDINAEPAETKTEETTDKPKLVPLAALESERKKRQELETRLKEVSSTQETYFEDSKKDGVFKDYIKNPLKVIGEINAEIANYEAVIPDDGAEEYRKARRNIAYWNGVKDEFSAKRIEVSERNVNLKTAEANLRIELGENAHDILDYASDLGFGVNQIISNPKLKESVKTMYAATHAEETARKKEVKKPQNSTKPSGDAGEGGGQTEEEIVMNPDTPSDIRIPLMRKRRMAG